MRRPERGGKSQIQMERKQGGEFQMRKCRKERQAAGALYNGEEKKWVILREKSSRRVSFDHVPFLLPSYSSRGIRPPKNLMLGLERARRRRAEVAICRSPGDKDHTRSKEQSVYISASALYGQAAEWEASARAAPCCRSVNGRTESTGFCCWFTQYTTTASVLSAPWPALRHRLSPFVPTSA